MFKTQLTMILLTCVVLISCSTNHSSRIQSTSSQPLKATSKPLQVFTGRWIAQEYDSENDYVIREIQFDPDGNTYVEISEGKQTKTQIVPTQYGKNTFLFELEHNELELQYELNENVLILWPVDEPEETLRFTKAAREKRYHTKVIDKYSNTLMPIVELSLDVTIVGEYAWTSVTYKILNPLDDEVEATFTLPLPYDAVLTGYALEIDDVFIDGVTVAKEDARRVFEAIEDRGIDPGLVENTGTNQFQTEIYPFESLGSRRIRVDYIERLKRNDGNLYQYQFPLQDYYDVEELEIFLKAERENLEPKFSSIFYQPGARESQADESHYQMRKKLKIKTPGELENFAFGFLNAETYEPLIEIAKDGDIYFSFEKKLDYIDFNDSSDVSHITLFWDASASMENYHSENINFLNEYLEELLYSTDRLTVELIIFADNIIEKKQFILEQDNQLCEVLEAQFSNIYYDGATNFESLISSSSITEKNLLFSDGNISVGESKFLQSDIPLLVITNGKHSNLPLLRSATQEGRGLVIDLETLDLEEAIEITKLNSPKIKIIEGLEDFDDVQFSIITDASPRLVIRGKTRGPQRDLFFQQDQEVLLIPLSDVKPTQGETAKHLWFASKIESLLIDPELNRKTIQALGIRYNQVTPYTSFIVLEDMDDYVENGIRPPESFPDANLYSNLRRDYVLHELDIDDPEEIMDTLLSAWKTRVEWWESRKPMDINKIKQRIKANQSRGGGSVEEILVTGSFIKGNTHTSIDIDRWLPDQPYIDAISQALTIESELVVYKEQAALYGNSPSFYMDCAHYFFQKGHKKIAARILSNILELYTNEPDMARVVAYNLLEFGMYDEALIVLEKVRRDRSQQATSYRDLARVWELKARASHQYADFQKSMDYYFQTALGGWSLGDPIRITALTELNRLFALAKRNNHTLKVADKRLIQLLDMDLRIVLSWNNRSIDLDLWVTEPSGELVSYNNMESESGALLPYDDVDGYGPEEYLARFALPGEYRLQAVFFSNNSIDVNGPVTLSIEVYTDYGKTSEQLITRTLRIEKEQEEIDLGKIQIQH